VTVYTYSRIPAFNPNTSPVSVAKSATGSVYDLGDTGFLTPLNLTLVATGAVTTSLVSDANGMFPDFTLVDRTTVAFKSGTQVFVLTTTTPIPGPTGPVSTVPGPPGPATTDASLLSAGTVADARLPSRLQDTALNATFVPKWKATTAYLAGDAVLSPAGDTVTAIANFTSGASFNAANWNYSATYAPIATAANRPSGIVLTKRFDPAKQVYNLNQGNFRRWRAALSSAIYGTGVARLNCYGDSITFGYLGTPKQWQGSYATQLRNRIAKRTSNAGTGVVNLVDYSGDDLRWTFAGTWSALAGYGPFGASAQQTNTPGSTVAFASDVACDSFTIHYLTSSGGGTFGGSVDVCYGSTVNANTGSLLYATTTISAGASGLHTLTLTAPASGYLYLIAVEATNGPSGIRVSRVSKGGAKVSDLVATANGAGASVSTSIDQLNPDLGILFFGHNEYLQQVAIATYKTNMQTAIDRIRTTKSGDVLLVACIPNSDQSKAITQDMYRQALYELADTNNLPLLDLAERWGSYAISNAAPLSLYGDVTHPNSKGYGDVAAAVFDVVMQGQ
jgi:lysophospholipase L1-like esterase